jgi:hypothetical protein
VQSALIAPRILDRRRLIQYPPALPSTSSPSSAYVYSPWWPAECGLRGAFLNCTSVERHGINCCWVFFEKRHENATKTISSRNSAINSHTKKMLGSDITVFNVLFSYTVCDTAMHLLKLHTLAGWVYFTSADRKNSLCATLCPPFPWATAPPRSFFWMPDAGLVEDWAALMGLASIWY